jgi:Bacterial PH domain
MAPRVLESHKQNASEIPSSGPGRQIRQHPAVSRRPAYRTGALAVDPLLRRTFGRIAQRLPVWSHSGVPGDVEFRLGRGYRARPLWRGCVFLVLAGIIYVVTMHIGGLTLGAIALLPLLWSLVSLATFFLRGRMRTRVTPSGIEVHRYRSEFVPWEKVKDIETVSYDRVADVPTVNRSGAVLTSGQGWKAPRKVAAVRVVRTSGHHLTLPAPLVTEDQSDPEFDDKVRLIRAHWQNAAGRA